MLQTERSGGFASGSHGLISWTLLRCDAWGWSCPTVTDLRVITVWSVIYIDIYIYRGIYIYLYIYIDIYIFPNHFIYIRYSVFMFFSSLHELFVSVRAHSEMFHSIIFSCQYHHSYYSDWSRGNFLKLFFYLFIYLFYLSQLPNCRGSRQSSADVLFPSSLLQLLWRNPKVSWGCNESSQHGASLARFRKMSGRRLSFPRAWTFHRSVLNGGILPRKSRRFITRQVGDFCLA